MHEVIVRQQVRRLTEPPGRSATGGGLSLAGPLILLLVGMFGGLPASVCGDVVVGPVMVATSGADGATLGIPRWKGYISELTPTNFWMSFANSGSSSNNISYTTNAGASWSTNPIVIDGYLDFHVSLFGQGGDLYFTMPGTSAINFRKFNSPAQSSSDAGPLISLPGTSPYHRSNIMLEPNGRIWIFTRQGGTPSENVRYFYSDNEGGGWTTNMAWSTNAPDIRIGSMPYVNGYPALVVLYLNDPRGYEYYLWNGSSFQAQPDHSVYALNVGYDRAFTHNQIGDTVMHLVFGDGSNLRHVWKNYAGGTGSWNTSVIMTEPNNSSIDWFPISSVRGNDLYLFYCRKQTADPSSAMIYYRKWSQATRAWSDATLVSTDPNNVANHDPNTCFRVPESAQYIPVFWSCGSGTVSLYYAKVVVTTEDDIIPPGRVIDLGQAPPSETDGSGPSASDRWRFVAR